jgi:hypothetical protein
MMVRVDDVWVGTEAEVEKREVEPAQRETRQNIIECVILSQLTPLTNKTTIIHIKHET